MLDNNNVCLSEIKNHARKKITHYKEQSAEKVAEYQEKIKDISKNKRIYVDEASFDSYLYREYVHTPKGQKVHESIKGKIR